MSAQLLPPILWEQIANFLDAGNTGRVEITVKNGRIVGYAVVASWKVDDAEVAPKIVEMGDPLRRRIQSSR